MADLEQRELYIGGLKKGPMQFVRQKISPGATLQDATAAAHLYDRTISSSASSSMANTHSPTHPTFHSHSHSHNTPMDIGTMSVRFDSPASSQRSAASSRSPSPDPRRPTCQRPSGSKRNGSPAPSRSPTLSTAERAWCDREHRCYHCKKVVRHKASECPARMHDSKN
jgi:hypothetical protein